MQQVIGPSALIVDDPRFLKDGNVSACVARQYTGTAGEITNCQAGISLHLPSDGASVATDWRLAWKNAGSATRWGPALRRSRPMTSACLPRVGPDGEEAGHRGRQAGREAGAVAGRLPAQQRLQRRQAHVLTLRGLAPPEGHADFSCPARSGPAPAPPVIATCQNRYQPDRPY
ncbi:transposase [Streptomyces sp. NPDC007205]|uniref:transposase n=1 Tax=Streptomyces sp. NPDC007205 TaxID=3154316 RepID=UPI0033E59CE9